MKSAIGNSLADKSVLIVDDEEIVVDVIKEVIGPAVSDVESAANGAEALTKLVNRDFDFILIDIKMPRMNGIDFFRFLTDIKPYLIKNVIFITGDIETEEVRSFIEKNRCRCLAKPFMIRELLEVMKMQRERIPGCLQPGQASE